MNRHEWTKQSPGYDTVKRVRERGFFSYVHGGKCGQIWRWRRGCEETDVKPFIVCNKERKWAFFSEYVINVVRCVFFIHSAHNSIILIGETLFCLRESWLPQNGFSLLSLSFFLSRSYYLSFSSFLALFLSLKWKILVFCRDFLIPEDYLVSVDFLKMVKFG